MTKKWLYFCLAAFVVLGSIAAYGMAEAKGGNKRVYSKTPKPTNSVLFAEELTIKKGQKVKLALQNVDTITHALVEKGLGIQKVVLHPGDRKVITIEGKVPGTYRLICIYHHLQTIPMVITVKK